MKHVETSARTVAEAIALALEILGADREEVEVDVLSEGSHGVLGIGGEEARVRVRLTTTMSGGEAAEAAPDDAIEVTRDVLEGILSRMELAATITYRADAVIQESERTPSPITFDIEGEDLGILIGRRGQTLACLQYMVRLMVSHRLGSPAPTIVIDVNGYKQHRYQSLQALAKRIAEQVEASGEPFTLEPMPAYERRIIHLSLAEHVGVTTQSTGIGEARKVVIMPR